MSTVPVYILEGSKLSAGTKRSRIGSVVDSVWVLLICICIIPMVIAWVSMFVAWCAFDWIRSKVSTEEYSQ